jgi:phosphatidate cytidylyltransferase
MWREVILLFLFSAMAEGGHSSFLLKSPMRSLETIPTPNLNENLPNKRKSDRLFTGVTLAAATTGAIFSQPAVFPSALALASTSAQNEYTDLLVKKNITSNFKFLFVATLLSYLTAHSFPSIHNILFPPLVFMMMTNFLLFKSELSSISEIGSTLLGMTLVGYLPSFWVRLRNLGGLVTLSLPAQLTLLIGSLPSSLVFPQGAILLALTWTGLVCSDVGAYVIGKLAGFHKLSDSLNSALGKASPKKTVEGVLGGALTSGIFWSLVGKFFRQSPGLGALFGTISSFVGLIGDISVSLLKRDAQVKDSGTLLGGHGGVLDRMDSYLLSAPLAFLFWQWCLPILKSGDPFDLFSPELLDFLFRRR